MRVADAIFRKDKMRTAIYLAGLIIGDSIRLANNVDKKGFYSGPSGAVLAWFLLIFLIQDFVDFLNALR